MAASRQTGRRANGGHRMVLKGRRGGSSPSASELVRAGRQNVATIQCSFPTAAEMAALSRKGGDASYVGPSAGLALQIPVIHILEPESMAPDDPSPVERGLALSVFAMEAPQVIALFQSIRNGM